LGFLSSRHRAWTFSAVGRRKQMACHVEEKAKDEERTTHMSELSGGWGWPGGGEEGTDLEVGHELAALGIYALKEVDLLL